MCAERCVFFSLEQVKSEVFSPPAPSLCFCFTYLSNCEAARLSGTGSNKKNVRSVLNSSLALETSHSHNSVSFPASVTVAYLCSPSRRCRPRAAWRGFFLLEPRGNSGKTVSELSQEVEQMLYTNLKALLLVLKFRTNSSSLVIEITCGF